VADRRHIAVTGGSGFIGSNLVDALVAGGHTVTVVDVRPAHRADVGFQRLDIGDVDALTEAFTGVDTVFHLAAVSNINDAFQRPLATIAINVAGTANVWEAARRAGVKRAVLASTVWVYAAAEGRGPFDEDQPFNVDNTGHIYTSSKIAAEMIVRNYFAMYGQAYTILRYGIPYGPRMRDELVMPIFVNRALRGETITINGDGSQFRNYVYIDDLCDAHLRALAPVAENETFNLEGTDEVSVRQLADAIRSIIGDQVRVEYVPARAGDYAGKLVSADKARRLLGWTPTTPFSEGIHRVVDYYLGRRIGEPSVLGER
jgi:UDP-glucose 4-epimerase